MKVIDRHSTKSYDVAITTYEGSKHYWCVTVVRGAEITGQETTFDRTTSLDVAREAANVLWKRCMTV